MERQKYPRNFHTKKNSLCSDFAFCKAFKEFFLSVYKIDNEALNVPSENIFA